MRISRIDVWKAGWGYVVEVPECQSGKFVVNEGDNGHH